MSKYMEAKMSGLLDHLSIKNQPLAIEQAEADSFEQRISNNLKVRVLIRLRLYRYRYVVHCVIMITSFD